MRLVVEICKYLKTAVIPISYCLVTVTQLCCCYDHCPHFSHQVGFDDTGKVVALKVDLYSDAGHVSNESPVGFLAGVIQNCYHVPNLLYRPYMVNTDTAANTWCRTPGEMSLANLF